jgi:hypothetical protein
MVSLTKQPLYLGGKSARYLLDKRLGGPQRRSGLSGELKNIPASVGNRTLVVQPVA